MTPRIDDLDDVISLLSERRMELVWHWQEIGRRMGRREGAMLMVARLLLVRFGVPPHRVLKRLCRARSRQLETWADRLVEAATLNEVFSKRKHSRHARSSQSRSV